MKKGIVCFFIVVSVLLSGCASKKENLYSADDPIDITVWTYYNGDQLSTFNQLVKEFNKTEGKEKGIHVKSVSQGSVSDLQENVVAAVKKKVGADKVPDLFSAYSDIAYTVDHLKKVVDLNQYFTKDELKQYITSYIQDGDILGNGKLKVFPVAKSTEILTINKTDFDKFSKATNVSYDDLSTVEGIVEVAQKYYEWTDSLTPEKNDGKAFFGRDAVANYIFSGSMQLGHEIFNVKNGKITLDFDKNVAYKLWENYYIPYIKGYFASSGRFRSDDIKTGNIIAYVGSSSSASFFPKSVIKSDDETYNIEMKTLPCPIFKDGKNYAIQQGAGMVVTKSTKAKESAAVEFLKWFTDTKQNISFSAGTGYLPVKKEANNIDKIVKKENNSNTKDVIKVALDTVKDNQLYANKAFEKGTDARDYVETMMSDIAVNDRQVVEENLKNGQSLQEATSLYTSQEYFEKWYEDTLSHLQNYIK